LSFGKKIIAPAVVCMMMRIDDKTYGGVHPLFDIIPDFPGFGGQSQGIDQDGSIGSPDHARAYLRIQIAGEKRDVFCDSFS